MLKVGTEVKIMQSRQGGMMKANIGKFGIIVGVDYDDTKMPYCVQIIGKRHPLWFYEDDIVVIDEVSSIE